MTTDGGPFSDIDLAATDREYGAALEKLEELRAERSATEAEIQEHRAELDARPEVTTMLRIGKLHARISTLTRRGRALDRAIIRQEATVSNARRAAGLRALERIRPAYAQLAERVERAGRDLAEAVAAEQEAREQLHRAGLDLTTLPHAAANFPWFMAPFNSALVDRISRAGDRVADVRAVAS